MTDLNVKKEYLNLIYADCGKGSAGEKIKELVTVPGTQYLIFGVILGVFPLLAQLGILTSSFVFAMGNTMIYAIMAIGFCLLMGYSGLASLGTAGFVGIGAYIAYYFMQVYGAPFGIAFIVTVMISLFSGVLVGFISLRIEGIYLAILTLGLSEILRNTFISLKSSIKLDMSKVRLFGVKIGEEQVYLLILALFVLLLFITSNLIRSPIGRALLSVKNSTSAAQAMGINLMKYRVLAFVISTVYAAIAGLMYMMLLRNMTTSTSTLLSMATFGVFIIYGLQSTLLSKIPFFVENPAFITMITGLLIILIVMFFPGGIAQMMGNLMKKRKTAKFAANTQRRVDGYGQN